MGLDMSVEKITRVTEEELKEITGKDYNDILNSGYNLYRAETIEKKEEEIVPIIDYLTEVQYIATYINLVEIKKDYDIPMDAWVSGSHTGVDGSAGYTFETEGNSFSVELTCEKVKKYIIKEETKGFVCKVKELAYWRKDYKLHEEFEQRCETPVVNCGYAPIPYDFLLELAEYNEQITIDDINDENSIIVYHPWW